MYARCKNSLEGYSCECLTGFEGDGETCTCALDYISIILRRVSNVAGFFQTHLMLKERVSWKKRFLLLTFHERQVEYSSQKFGRLFTQLYFPQKSNIKFSLLIASPFCCDIKWE